MPTARAARRATARLGALVLTGALLAACGGSSDADSADGANGKITLTVDLFGSFGYKEAGLYAEYEKLHPNITIKQTDTEDEADYWKSLQTRLAGGGGLADVQGIEVGRIATVTQQQTDKFEDLKKYGAESLKGQFAEAKWAAATGKNGEVLGLGTDVGPEAMCYRTDLLKKAGLPTDREELAQRWSSWDGYLELGKQYKAKAPGKSAWLDSVGSLYSIMIGQQKERYYSASGELIWDKNPALLEAWDRSVEAAESGLSAELDQWSPQWNQAFAAGSFATIPCPAWMLGYIKEKAGPKAADQWDIAPAPGPANWGGSFLSVPEAAKNKEEAVKLAAWLTAPEQQAKLFREQASFPSSPKTYEMPDVAGAQHEYFGDAPIGEIFSRAAEDMPTLVLGEKDLAIQTAFTDVGVLQVEQQGKSPEAGWDAALKNIDNLLDR